MLSRLRFLLLLPVATLIACGGSSNSPIGTTYTPSAGDYVITVGSWDRRPEHLHRQPRRIREQCIRRISLLNPEHLRLSFSGHSVQRLLCQRSSDPHFAAFSNSVATLTINLPLSNNNLNQQLASGTSVITGGTCALASSTLQAQFIPAFTGSWTVTLTNPTDETAFSNCAAVFHCDHGRPVSRHRHHFMHRQRRYTDSPRRPR